MAIRSIVLPLVGTLVAGSVAIWAIGKRSARRAKSPRQSAAGTIGARELVEPPVLWPFNEPELRHMWPAR